MKNRFIVVYTVFASIIFIFSLSFFGFNLYREFTTNLEKSDKKITVLTNEIRTLSNNISENNASYAKLIKDSIGDAGAYAYIQVKRSGETVVLYPAGKSKEETISKLTKSYERKIIVKEQPVEIIANIYLIKPDSIFYFARISFLLILIITLITIIMIIYLNLSESSGETISLEEESENIEDSDQLQIETEEESPSISENETEAATEADSATETDAETENEVSAEEATEVSEETTGVVEEASSAEEKAEVTPEVTPEEVKAILAEPLTDAQIEPAKLPLDEIKPQNTENDPSGLFNPSTGIGWESYILTRLANEIDRATASEFDLSLFIIRMTDINRDSEEFKNVCNYLAIQFQFKDLLFEYKDDSIVAIKISMDIDEAIILADKLYSDICNIINSNKCRIGISSRSIRMVTGERLMLEAEQAIEHSDESSPVIAFRVDSEKYRQLMEQNQA